MNGWRLNRRAVREYCPGGQGMRTVSRSLPFEAVLDRCAGIRSANERDFGRADLCLTIPELDTADVPIEIDGDSFDKDGIAGTENSAILRPGDHQARRRDAVVADENSR